MAAVAPKIDCPELIGELVDAEVIRGCHYCLLCRGVQRYWPEGTQVGRPFPPLHDSRALGDVVGAGRGALFGVGDRP